MPPITTTEHPPKEPAGSGDPGPSTDTTGSILDGAPEEPPRPADWHRHGVLELTAERRGDRTVLSAQRAAFPAGNVRVRDVDGDGIGELQITNPSGGLLAGDRMDTTVHVRPGARISVVTQGANRICGTAAGTEPRTTTVANRLTVQDGAIVEWLPHHLVPYARSRVHQRTAVELAPTAGLLLWEAISSGRSGRGERWAWDRLDTRLRITEDGRPRLVDGAILPAGGEPFDGADLAATFVVVLPPPAARATDLADALHDAATTIPGVLGSASAVDDRLVVGRVLARDAVALYATLAAWRAPARATLGWPLARRPIT